MRPHEPSLTDSATMLSVPVNDIVEPAESAFRDAINPAGQWFHHDGNRPEHDAIDSDRYLLAGIKLALDAGQAASNSAQRYGDALDRVNEAVTALAGSDDPDKQRKFEALTKQQRDLTDKKSRFETVASMLGAKFDKLMQRFWELHPTTDASPDVAPATMH